MNSQGEKSIKGELLSKEWLVSMTYDKEIASHSYYYQNQPVKIEDDTTWACEGKRN